MSETKPLDPEVRLRMWHNNLSVIAKRMSAALQTVESVRGHEDAPWGVSGPLLLVSDALDECDDDIASMQLEMAEFIREQEASA